MNNSAEPNQLDNFGVEIEDKKLMKILALIALVTAVAMSSQVSQEMWTFTTRPVSQPHATGLIKHDNNYTDSRYPAPMPQQQDNSYGKKNPSAE